MNGPGGIGKTALTYTTALSTALGINLLESTNTNPFWRLHKGRLKTYIFGLEDDLDEMKRRLMAVMQFHGVDPRDLDGHLILGDGCTDQLILAISEHHKLIRTAQVDRLIAVLIDNQIKLLILDPLVRLHFCNENDNGEMNFVMMLLKEIAVRADVAIWLVHHSGKSGTDLDPHGGRGASAIPAAGRVNETLTTPSQAERDRFGFGTDVIRLEQTKANMSPSGGGCYLRVKGAPIGNGDFAQVIELIDPKDQTERMDEYLFDEIVAALDTSGDGNAFWSTTRSAKNWVGHAIMKGGIGTESRATSLIGDWFTRGLLVPVLDAKDAQRRPLATAVRLDKDALTSYRAERFNR